MHVERKGQGVNVLPIEPIKMSPERLEQIHEHLRTFGPANCWTGTTGELCRMMFELLAEREILLMQLEERTVKQ